MGKQNARLATAIASSAMCCVIAVELDESWPTGLACHRRRSELKHNIITTTLAAMATAALISGAVGTASAFTACQVTDTGGVDDKGFNATAWKGAQTAKDTLSIDVKLLESKTETDYEPNINAFIAENCDIIITVGFLLGDGTKAAAEANPDTLFSIVDYAYDPVIPNVLGQLYATDEAAFMAGYLAAALTNTGVVGTYGGINIGPAVTDFMDGFVWGVWHHNEVKGTDVQVLGWDPVARDGLFTGNFNSLDDGRAFAQNLYDEGADIVLPVAGPVGQGSAALADELGTDELKIIGVDADQYLTDPQKQHVYLTSVLKRMDSTVVEAITQAKDGTFKGGVLVGTLATGGVGLAPYHDLDGEVPDEIKAEIEALRAGIIDGSIPVGG
jgi:basic membrane protein A